VKNLQIENCQFFDRFVNLLKQKLATLLGKNFQRFARFVIILKQKLSNFWPLCKFLVALGNFETNNHFHPIKILKNTFLP
jgi:hypothetical protein